MPETPQPTRSSHTLSHDSPASSHANQQTQMAAVASVQEFDDFGLPIRKYASPPPDNHTRDGDQPSGSAIAAKETGGDTAQDKLQDQTARAASAAHVSGNGEQKGDLGVPTPPGKGNGQSAGNSEGARLEEAPSTPIPQSPDHESASRNAGPQAHDELPKTPVPSATATVEPSGPDAVRIDKSDPSHVDLGAPSATARPRSDTISSVQAISGPSLKDVNASKEAGEKRDVGHSRDPSAASAVPSMSEFSHQQLTAPKTEDKDADDGGWQTMPAYAPYDIYDDDNRLVAKEHNEEDDETYGYAGLGGAGKGYTRVLVDEDAQSETSLDGNTKYLFKETVGTSAADLDEQRDAVSQLQATKDLLTEGQRIAYVGATRLELAMMVKEADSLAHTNKRTKKDIATAAEAMKMWAQKIMVRLYAHMEISPAEQVMIEQLAEHGVMPSDLTPVLMQNARVKNPMAKEKVPSAPSTPKAGAKSSRSSVSTRTGEESPAMPPPPYESHVSEDMPEVKTPSQLPSSQKIDIDLRWTVLCDLFLVLIVDSVYDARSRVLLERMGKTLEVPWLDICRFEKRVTDALEMQQQAESENWNEEEHLENRRKMALKRKYVMMGLATVGGGLVIGLSAGLAAPLIGAGLAAGFTTIGVGGTGSFLAGAGGAAIITSGAAASGSYMGGKAANKRMGAVRTFEYRPLHNNKRVNLIITISGWMTSTNDDVRLPFSTVDPVMGDIYSILWEPEMLTSMGDTINILATEALTQGLQQVLGSTILMGLMAALQLPVVLSKLAYLIDNPWSVSMDRAWSAGLILADSLIDRNLGARPITLVGYSLGSRVIFSCLLELARKGAFGLVQNAYLFGSPLVIKQEEYLRCRTVVSGRFVNGYNKNDWILGYLFRLTNGGIRRVAGLATIEGIPGIENMDCSEFVVGHMDYRQAMPRLLRECGWMVESDEFTEIEDPDPDQHRERQRELISEIEEARQQLDKDGATEKKGAFGFFSRKKKQKQDWEIYEDSHKAPGPNGQKTEDKFGNNHGVLFDVDAMRAELAKEAEDAKNSDDPQARQLSSTLPPIQINSSPDSPRHNLRETQSEYSTTTLRSVSSPGLGTSQERTPTLGSGRFDYSTPRPSPSFVPYNHEEEEEVQMTFDTAFADDGKPPKPPTKDDMPASRPEYKSSQTVPNMAVHDPWADDDDDDDFGKEKEISMTFA